MTLFVMVALAPLVPFSQNGTASIGQRWGSNRCNHPHIGVIRNKKATRRRQMAII